MISFDDTTLSFTVETDDENWEGSYEIVINTEASGGLLDGQMISTSFFLDVQVKEATKPYFEEEFKE